jgi:hypothetical protein
MLPFCWISRQHKNVIFVFSPLKNNNQKSPRASTPNSLPSTAIGGLNRHPKLKHFFHFVDRNLWVALSEMNFTISLTGEDKLHNEILTCLYLRVNTEKSPDKSPPHGESNGDKDARNSPM